jgi:hypothetical protein
MPLVAELLSYGLKGEALLLFRFQDLLGGFFSGHDAPFLRFRLPVLGLVCP